MTDAQTGNKKPLAVGDRVIIEETGGNGKTGVISRVLPRRTRLSRSHPANPRLQQVTAANVDQALIVCSVSNPPLRCGIIDRHIIASEYGGIIPVICINKKDLAGKDSPHLRVSEIYEKAGYRVLMTSAKTGEGCEKLSRLLAGKTTAIAGHSGVGKSSLINAVQPGLKLKTAPLGWKGTHCTAKATLMKLNCGGYVVDTPGVRELHPWDIGKHEIQQFFPEIWELASQCRMPDCTHMHEPECAVKRALENNLIPRMRYDSYAGILCSVESSDSIGHANITEHTEQFQKRKKERGTRTRRQKLEKMIDEYRREQGEEGRF